MEIPTPSDEASKTSGIESVRTSNDVLSLQDSEQTDVTDFPTPSEGSVITPDASMINFFHFEDDFGDELDTRDLVVRVDNPEKHSSTLDSYVTFRITTKTTRSDFDGHEYSVRRRYNDFFWLKQKLEQAHPSCIIPPLPEKYALQQLQRFTQEFLRSRMIGLHQFLNRVVEHKVLSKDENLKVFLTSKPYEFVAHRKKDSVGLVGRVSDTIQSLATPYLLRSQPPPEEFQAASQYATLLGDKLACTERIAQRISKEEQEHVLELNELQAAFTLWGASESELGPGLCALATALDKCASAQQEVTDLFQTKQAPILHEQLLQVESVKEALKRRDSAQTEYELTADALSKRKQERQQLETSGPGFSINVLLGKSAESTKKDREQRLDDVIEQLTRSVEESHLVHQNMNVELKEEMEEWNTSRQKDIRQVFLGMADQRINYYQRCLSAWEAALSELRTKGSSTT
ncbi:sorting nexin-7-like [Ornithodoros turicata]|uniref:Putative sorting nexin ixodes scapularis sorting nexin n=1 Tax=Ornithodoros turicata TaxID=34597 RepID=A0A2R5LFD5_9ACAR